MNTAKRRPITITMLLFWLSQYQYDNDQFVQAVDLVASNTIGMKQKSAYKSDDTDELMEGLFTNKRAPKEEACKPKTEVDNLVQEAYEQAMQDVPRDDAAVKTIIQKQSAPASEVEQWASLIQSEDPLQDTDIYATIEKKEEKPLYTVQNLEQDDLDDDIGDLLDKSFTKEKKMSNFVKNIPSILQKKKANNYNELFSGITEKDIETMKI